MRRQFLDRGFTAIKEVKRLPRPVLEEFTEQNGLRPVMADLGKGFIAGDFIYNSSVPRERLIFAGMSGDKCFVHYERGGRGYAYLLALFEVTSQVGVKPLWQATVAALPLISGISGLSSAVATVTNSCR